VPTKRRATRNQQKERSRGRAGSKTNAGRERTNDTTGKPGLGCTQSGICTLARSHRGGSLGGGKAREQHFTKGNPRVLWTVRSRIEAFKTRVWNTLLVANNAAFVNGARYMGVGRKTGKSLYCGRNVWVQRKELHEKKKNTRGVKKVRKTATTAEGGTTHLIISSTWELVWRGGVQFGRIESASVRSLNLEAA